MPKADQSLSTPLRVPQSPNVSTCCTILSTAPAGPSRCAFAAVVLAAAPLVASASTTADARLIAMCTELVTRNDAKNAENNLYWDRGIDPPEAVFDRQRATTPAYHRLKGRIATARATTMAGMQAKARAVLSHGGERPDPEADDAMGWSLAEDLAAIGGAA